MPVVVPRSAVDHTPGRAQTWMDADADIRTWVSETVAGIASIFDAALIGVYLHGSLAMGGYYRPKSDLDLLVVVERRLREPERRAAARRLLDAFDRRPTVGGLETSIVDVRQLREFVHPLPFELHFSEQWAAHVRAGGIVARGSDPDLAAHCTAARSRGIALVGPSPTEVFAPVPHDAFLESILDDFRWIIVDGGIFESPYYGVLNACRVLQVITEGPGSVPGKEEGARWALGHLPSEHEQLITEALDCYRSSAEVAADQRRTHGHSWDRAALVRFRGLLRA